MMFSEAKFSGEEGLVGRIVGAKFNREEGLVPMAPRAESRGE